MTESVNSGKPSTSHEKKGWSAASKAKPQALPRGVKLRQFATEERLQIAFTYRGNEHRELLPNGPINKSTIQNAQGLRHEILRKIAEGTFVYTDYFPNSKSASDYLPPSERTLIGELLKSQINKYDVRLANRTISKSTHEGYTKALKGERLGYWADKSISAFTEPALKTWLKTLDGITAKTAKNIMTPLRNIVEEARGLGLLQHNPFKDINVRDDLKSVSKASNYKVNPFPEEDRKKIIAACRPDEWPMIQFWFATGLRHGEMIALRWTKIDFESRTARIDTNIVNKQEKAPKTVAGIRLVDLSDEAMEALRAQKEANTASNEFVWLNTSTRERWETDGQIYKTLWVPLIKRAKVTYRNPYQCRHTFASAALTAGGNPWYLAQQLGHEDLEMIFRRYGKFIAKDFQKPRFEQSRPKI